MKFDISKRLWSKEWKMHRDKTMRVAYIYRYIRTSTSFMKNSMGWAVRSRSTLDWWGFGMTCRISRTSPYTHTHTRASRTIQYTIQRRPLFRGKYGTQPQSIQKGEFSLRKSFSHNPLPLSASRRRLLPPWCSHTHQAPPLNSQHWAHC